MYSVRDIQIHNMCYYMIELQQPEALAAGPQRAKSALPLKLGV